MAVPKRHPMGKGEKVGLVRAPAVRWGVADPDVGGRFLEKREFARIRPAGVMPPIHA